MSEYEKYGIQMPQPGEIWRIQIRPVEWDCPKCHTPFHIGGSANDGRLARIVEPVENSFVHIRRGCNATIPLPEGWIWYSTAEFDGDHQYYTLPYTMFERVE